MTRLRPARREDAAAVAELISAVERADGDVRDTRTEDIEGFWREIDPEELALVADGDGGGLLAYVDVFPRQPYTHVDGYVHPDARGRGVGVQLLRAAEELATRGQAGEVVLHSTVVGGSDGERLLTQEGYRHVRSFFRMVIAFEAAPEPPDWPPEIAVMPYMPGRDDRVMHETLDDAFQDHWGHESRSLEEFVRAFAEDRQLVPQASFLVQEGDEWVGAVLCKRRFGIGWVQSLGVRPGWRKQGVGLALLRQAFRSFYDLGERSVGLGVDAESTTGATRLYERAGMEVEVRYDTYEKRVRVG
jgi:mycothiol synthase